MVHVCLKQRLVEVSHGRQVAHVLCPAPHLDAQFAPDICQVFPEQFVGIVVDVVLPVGAEVVVGVGVRRRRVEVRKGARHVPRQVEQRAEQVRVFHCQARCAAASHAVSFDTPAAARADRAPGRVDVGNQFANDEGLALEAPVVGVLVERAHAAVGKHCDHGRPASFADARVEHPHVVETVQLVVAGAMQVVDHRVPLVPLGVVARRQVDAVAHVGFVRPGVEGVMRHASRQMVLGLVDPDCRRTGRLLSWREDHRYFPAGLSLRALSGSIHQLSSRRTALPTRYSYFATASCSGLSNLSQRTNRSSSGMCSGM